MVKKMETPPAPKKIQPYQTTKEFLELTARQRMLEERYTEVNKKAEIIEQNMLIKNKKITNDLKILKEDINKLKKEITEVKDTQMTIINEIKLLARKEDIEVLKKYMEYWKPINFVTRKQLEKEIADLRNEKEEK